MRRIKIILLNLTRVKSSEGTSGLCLIKCCSCCLICLEKFMKYINSNAYTIIAIEGLSFCQSAQKSFLIVMENALRIIAINSVGDFMLFLSKISVTTTTLLLAVVWLQVPIDNVKIKKKIYFVYLVYTLLIHKVRTA